MFLSIWGMSLVFTHQFDNEAVSFPRYENGYVHTFRISNMRKKTGWVASGEIRNSLASR